VWHEVPPDLKMNKYTVKVKKLKRESRQGLVCFLTSTGIIYCGSYKLGNWMRFKREKRESRRGAGLLHHGLIEYDTRFQLTSTRKK
jgi:hypothetical protein